MRQKICILVSLGFIIILSSLSHVFAQKEENVMKRYDYSSPKASYESLKKAIKNEDFEGVYIHMWQFGKVLSNTAQITFEESLRKIQNSKKCSVKDVEEWYSSNGEWIKFTETEFLEESKKQHGNNIEGTNTGATYCFITAQRKSDGKQIQLQTINIDGTKEWWIFIYPGGE